MKSLRYQRTIVKALKGFERAAWLTAAIVAIAAHAAASQTTTLQAPSSLPTPGWSQSRSPLHTNATEKAELERVLHPFWTTNLMRSEPLLFTAPDTSSPPTAKLLFTPIKLLRLTSGDGVTIYEPGRDYSWHENDRTLTLPAASRIPHMTLSELFPPKGAKNSYGETKNGGSSLFFAEGGKVFQQIQVFVTYEHTEPWSGFIPKPAGKQLLRTMAKLHARQPVRFVVLGDSISSGACASNNFGPPYQPPYVGLAAEALRSEFHDDVTLVNLAVGGKTTTWGVDQAAAVAAEKPDIVILAFGMNDASARIPTETYAAQTKAIMSTIRATNPDVEFVLVATMTANPDWAKADQSLYAAYRTELFKMSGEGVAIADITTVWNDLVTRKKFEDLTGNGINHPNDFGHMVYAQTIAALFH